MKRQIVVPLFIGFLLGIIAPILLSKSYHKLRPYVSDEWLKARCYEFSTLGPEQVKWKKVGEKMWYFEKEYFGARFFHLDDSLFFLILSPDGDGDAAYLYTSQRKVFGTPDDAMSHGLSWSQVKQIDPKDEWFLKTIRAAFSNEKFWVGIN
ncbi:MAG TPA: hypothetical protein VNL73_04410 [Verrucomicrobiae bacterium]|nr:hypothetical protein [Verrucomicrobiae bacterium]